MMGLGFFTDEEVIIMKKLQMRTDAEMTFEEGCNRYLEDCRRRNLREGTIRHYRQSYDQFYRYFDPDMPLKLFNKEQYEKYVVYLRDTMQNDVSINSYLRDLITTMHFLMNEGFVEQFRMRSIRVDAHSVETYTEDELTRLLKKPNIKTCKYMEYQCWVITNFLFSTGVRQRSLIHIKIKDVDFDMNTVRINVTKNRKPLIVPLNKTMGNILREFLKHRQHQSEEDFLFSNVFGQQLTKSTSYAMLYGYNKGRGVERTGIHRYRHTFAKQWILNGGNVVALSRMLGHSNLNITQNYINLLVTDLSKQVDEINLLDRFSGRKSIKL